MLWPDEPCKKITMLRELHKLLLGFHFTMVVVRGMVMRGTQVLCGHALSHYVYTGDRFIA